MKYSNPIQFVIKPFLVLILLFITISCVRFQQFRASSIEPSLWYQSLSYKIEIPTPTQEQRAKFNRRAKGEIKTIRKENGRIITGSVTNNKEFLEEVMKPLVLPYVDELKQKHPAEIISALTLFGFEIYHVYFGREFFRWAGDILDLDEPQKVGIRHKYRYGLDCSGFASMPYELAVYFGLMNPEDESAVFSSRGFEIYSKKHNIKDEGGTDGTSNNFRVDSIDMMKLGSVIVSVDKGGSLSEENIKKLQPGDIAGREGHVGIIVDINGKLYYLESGGQVVPPRGWKPIPVAEAIKIFAENGPVIIQRSLPDYKK